MMSTSGFLSRSKNFREDAATLNQTLLLIKESNGLGVYVGKSNRHLHVQMFDENMCPSHIVNVTPSNVVILGEEDAKVVKKKLLR